LAIKHQTIASGSTHRTLYMLNKLGEIGNVFIA